MDQIEQWVNSEPKVSDILVEIQNANVPVKEQAEIAFHKLSELYDLPKMPDDVQCKDDADGVDPASVYQILGMIKYLQPDDDPRGQVLSAVYYVKNGYTISLRDVLKKKFGRKLPTGVGIGFINENSAVEVIFVTSDQSWFELGCKLFMKLS